MAQVRIQDGLARLVEHFVQEDDVAVDKTLEVCKRLIERFSLEGISLMIERTMAKLFGTSNMSVNSLNGDVSTMQSR
jgi:hypothetical protein